MTMKTVGVIPSRWDSVRFPGKSLALLGGKPLIQWVLERAGQAETLDELLVATDDSRIRAVVEQAGGRVIMTRSDHPSGTDRIAEALRGREADLVVNIQGDEPLIDPGLIDELVHGMAENPEWDVATAVVPLKAVKDIRDPSVVKVVWSKSGEALYFSRSVIPFGREKEGGIAADEGVYWRHVGIYVYRREFLDKLVETPPCKMEQLEKLEQLRILYLGGRIKVLQAKESGPGVDVPEDVEKVEKAMEAAGLI